MEVTHTPMKRCDLLTVRGRIDSGTAPDFEREISELLDDGRKNIIVNLSETTFISSAGMKVLLASLKKVRSMLPAGDVVLSQVPEGAEVNLKENFDLAGFTHLFQFYESDVEAVGSF
jgi:anti-sigma B factor antagonist